MQHRSSGGWGALHVACRDHEPWEVEDVLRARSAQSVAERTNFGWTPLHVAADGGRCAIVELLLQHMKASSQLTAQDVLQAKTASGETASSLAEARRQVLLEKATDHRGACAVAETERVIALLKAEAEVQAGEASAQAKHAAAKGLAAKETPQGGAAPAAAAAEEQGPWSRGVALGELSQASRARHHASKSISTLLRDEQLQILSLHREMNVWRQRARQLAACSRRNRHKAGQLERELKKLKADKRRGSGAREDAPAPTPPATGTGYYQDIRVHMLAAGLDPSQVGLPPEEFTPLPPHPGTARPHRGSVASSGSQCDVQVTGAATTAALAEAIRLGRREQRETAWHEPRPPAGRDEPAEPPQARAVTCVPPPHPPEGRTRKRRAPRGKGLVMGRGVKGARRVVPPSSETKYASVEKSQGALAEAPEPPADEVPGSAEAQEYTSAVAVVAAVAMLGRVTHELTPPCPALRSRTESIRSVRRRSSASGFGRIDHPVRLRDHPLPDFCPAPLPEHQHQDPPSDDDAPVQPDPPPMDNMTRRWSLLGSTVKSEPLSPPSPVHLPQDVAFHVLSS
eukprot:TRINITY_DN13026_c0_g1_i1.p1 TRINITY_DN13026_c0_g1~~TRINITY_DN13026_c0_g1_i1.p1  ORF type:complete len:570 (+),score=91.58 TRINITY_DN13026_c0_g1_i1:113-1822(+)